VKINVFVKNLDSLLISIKEDKNLLLSADAKARSAVGYQGVQFFKSEITETSDISKVASEYKKKYFKKGEFEKRFLKRKTPYKFLKSFGRYIASKDTVNVGVAKKFRPQNMDAQLSKILENVQRDRTLSVTKKMRGLFSSTRYPLKKTTSNIRIKRRYYMINTYRKMKNSYLNTYNNKLKEVIR